MKSMMEMALGESWVRMPEALKAHYQVGPNVDLGAMDIDFPGWMKPYLYLLHMIGALVPRRGKQVSTRVEKEVVARCQTWHRTLTFDDGQTVVFNSHWEYAGGNRVIEYVNSIIGLEMAAYLEGNSLRYEGVRYVIRLGFFKLGLPEWMVLGHTTIEEHASADGGFDMDFRLTHPWLGEVFRYSGHFQTLPRA